MILLTLPQLRLIMPNAGKRAAMYLDPLNAAMIEFDITTPARIAAFLATLAIESGQFLYTEEIASGAAYDDREDLGNTRPEAIAIATAHGSTPGPWWKGHGPIQITGFDNHRACGEFLGLDLLNNPRLLCAPVHGCRAAGWFWMVKNLNKYADLGDFVKITKRVNGGTSEGPPTHLAKRREIWKRALAVLGASTAPEKTP